MAAEIHVLFEQSHVTDVPIAAQASSARANVILYSSLV